MRVGVLVLVVVLLAGRAVADEAAAQEHWAAAQAELEALRGVELPPVPPPTIGDVEVSRDASDDGEASSSGLLALLGVGPCGWPDDFQQQADAFQLRVEELDGRFAAIPERSGDPRWPARSLLARASVWQAWLEVWHRAPIVEDPDAPHWGPCSGGWPVDPLRVGQRVQDLLAQALEAAAGPGQRVMVLQVMDVSSPPRLDGARLLRPFSLPWIECRGGACGRAMAALDRGDWEAVELQLSLAVAGKPDDREALANQGLLQLMAGDHAGALERAEAAGLVPEARLVRAVALRGLERVPEAELSLLHLARGPLAAFAWEQLGWLRLQDRGDLEGARLAFRAAEDARTLPDDGRQARWRRALRRAERSRALRQEAGTPVERPAPVVQRLLRPPRDLVERLEELAHRIERLGERELEPIRVTEDCVLDAASVVRLERLVAGAEALDRELGRIADSLEPFEEADEARYRRATAWLAADGVIGSTDFDWDACEFTWPPEVYDAPALQLPSVDYAFDRYKATVEAARLARRYSPWVRLALQELSRIDPNTYPVPKPDRLPFLPCPDGCADAVAAWELGRRDAGRILVTEALAAHPDDPHVAHAAAVIRIRDLDHAAALPLTVLPLAALPDEPAVQLARSAALRGVGRLDEAQALLEPLADGDHDLVREARINLGILLLDDRKEYAAALRVFATVEPDPEVGEYVREAEKRQRKRERVRQREERRRQREQSAP